MKTLTRRKVSKEERRKTRAVIGAVQEEMRESQEKRIGCSAVVFLEKLVITNLFLGYLRQ